ncbi:MAG: response regulator transcription factor [Bacteroidales bacterium]|nr:response regulator transcription factor [Bacteroidales bacterium]
MDVVIVEDELLAVKNLKTVLDEIGGINIIAVLESIAESVKWFESHLPPDLIFMDIHLADGLAFEIFEGTTIQCPVIFTTAYDEYALKAYKVNSIDYLLKPIDTQAVRKSIQKYRTLNPFHDMNTEFTKLLTLFRQLSRYKTNFLISKKGDKITPLPADSIAYIYIDNGIVKAITMDKASFTLENTLDEIAGMLNPSFFYRANRQYIVSRMAIKDVDLWFNNRLAVNLRFTAPERITISKERSRGFKSWLASS